MPPSAGPNVVSWTEMSAFSPLSGSSLEQLGISRGMILVPRPQVVVISDQSKLASIYQYAMKLAQRRILHDPPFVVPLLRPGIGEVKVNDIRDRIRASKPDELRGVGPEHAHVVQFAPPQAVRRVPVEFPRPFDAEKVRLELQRRMLNEITGKPGKK